MSRARADDPRARPARRAPPGRRRPAAARAPGGDEAPPLRIAVVQWTGRVGGSEVLSMTITAALRRLGVDAEVVFVTHPGPLTGRLAQAGTPSRSLGLTRGRDVLAHPRAYARVVAQSGPDGALVAECGFMGAALRAGGYRAPIVAVEHGGSLLPLPSLPRRLLRAASRAAGAWADDAEVGVSDWIVERMRAGPHARPLLRIYNGIDPAEYPPPPPPPPLPPRGPLVAGFAGRLVAGKGADHLIRGVAQAGAGLPVRLLIAGDGVERGRLTDLTRSLGLAEQVEFLGMLDDVRELWARCHVAVFPSDRWPESFGMAALEAMACGQPVIATRRCALPEVVLDGESGTIVPPADAPALARALVGYGRDEPRRRAHGAGARRRALEDFPIDACALAYRDVFAALTARPGPR